MCLLSNRTRKYKIGVPPVLLKLFFNLSFFSRGLSLHTSQFVSSIETRKNLKKKSQQRIQREPEDLGGNDGNEAGRNNSQLDKINTHT